MLTIGVIANKGGQGKTTTAINLAHGLALKGRRVLLVDCDDQGHIANTFNIDTENQPTLFNLLMSDIPVQEVIIEIRHNLYAILSDQSLYAGLIELQAIKNRIERATQLRRLVEKIDGLGFDYVIFDGKPGQTDFTYNIILASNYIFIPVNVSGSDFLGLSGLNTFITSMVETIKEQVEDVGNWLDRICLIPYFLRTGIKDSYRDYQALIDQFPDLVTPPIRFSQALANSPRKAQTIFEYPALPRNNGIEDFHNLVKLILSYEEQQ